MAKVNVAGVLFAVISFMIMIGILIVFIKMCLHRATDRTSYNLKHKIEPPSKYLLVFIHFIDAYIWIIQLYVITISFISYNELKDLCDAAYPELGKYCKDNFVLDQDCMNAAEERQKQCKQHRECDILISGQYNSEGAYFCDGPECICSSNEAFFALPMLMMVTFGVAFLFDIAKILSTKWYFWNYLQLKDSHNFCIAFVSDAPWLDCCTCCCAQKSFEAIMHFYYYKRKYFRYNCITITYIILRYIIFFISVFIMNGLIHGLETYKTNTIIAWYDIIPLFVLWIITEFVIKLRYKCIAPYTKREHVLFILAMILQVDEYNVVRIISEYMGSDDLAEYEIKQIESEKTELHYSAYI